MELRTLFYTLFIPMHISTISRVNNRVSGGGIEAGSGGIIIGSDGNETIRGGNKTGRGGSSDRKSGAKDGSSVTEEGSAKEVEKGMGRLTESNSTISVFSQVAVITRTVPKDTKKLN